MLITTLLLLYLEKSKKTKNIKREVLTFKNGSFTRGISLPPNVKAEDITAKFEKSVLELKLPKTPSSSKKIEIK